MHAETAELLGDAWMIQCLWFVARLFTVQTGATYEKTLTKVDTNLWVVTSMTDGRLEVMTVKPQLTKS